jgi:hypothetical protein
LAGSSGGSHAGAVAAQSLPVAAGFAGLPVPVRHFHVFVIKSAYSGGFDANITRSSRFILSPRAL